jgi:glycosidase
MGLAYLLTTRGIPMIYYGTEIAMAGLEHEGHGYIRKDFPGGWPDDSVSAFSAEGRTELQQEAFDFLQSLLNWRKTNTVIHYGNLKQFLPEDGVYVYFRYNNEQSVMIIMNNNEAQKTLKTGRFNESMQNYLSGYEIITGKNIANLNPIEIPAKTAMIIELKR